MVSPQQEFSELVNDNGFVIFPTNKNGHPVYTLDGLELVQIRNLVRRELQVQLYSVYLQDRKE
jgi:hypothetical protein